MRPVSIRPRRRAVDTEIDWSRGRQSRWWFVASAAVAAAAGLMSTRVGVAELPPKTASDARGVVGALSAFSLLALGLQLVLVSVLTRWTEPASMPRPPSVRSTALSAVAAAVVAGIATMVFVDSDLTFELEAGVAVGVTIGCIVGSVPGRSVLMGDERWRDYGLISIATALSRLALTAGVAGHASFLRVIAAVVLSEAVGTFLTVMATRHEPRVRAWPSGSGRRLRIGAAASAGMVLVLVLSSVSSRRRLGSDAQIYNQSASVARIVFALVFAVAFVFFPAMARLPIGSVPLRRTFHSTLLLSIAAALPVVAAVMVFPTEFAEIVTPGTTASVRAVRILTPAFACCGIAVVSFAQYIAHGSRFALSAWPAAIVMLIGLLTASSANGLAWWALITSVILLATASIPALLRVQPLLRPHTIHLADTDQTTSSEGVTIIVPSYNPGRNVGRTVCAIYDSFSSAGVDLRLVVVSDGSTDESPEIIDALDTPNLVHLRHEENRGKGAALRTGFAAAATPIVGFIDADGDLPANQLIEMVRIQQQTGADIVFGSKRHSDSTVSVSLVRRIYSPRLSVSHPPPFPTRYRRHSDRDQGLLPRGSPGDGPGIARAWLRARSGTVRRSSRERFRQLHRGSRVAGPSARIDDLHAHGRRDARAHIPHLLAGKDHAAVSACGGPDGATSGVSHAHVSRVRTSRIVLTTAAPASTASPILSGRSTGANAAATVIAAPATQATVTMW